VTYTPALTKHVNRFGTHIHWEDSGGSPSVGVQQTGRHSFWIFKGFALADSVHAAGPQIAMVPDEADDAGAYTCVEHYLEQGAGSATEDSDTHTFAWPTWDHTIYADSAAAGGGTGTIGAPFNTLSAAVAQAKSDMTAGEKVRVLGKRGSNFAVAGSLWNFEESGLLGFHAYGAGVDPIMTLGSDFVVFNGIGQHNSTNNLAIDFRNWSVVGTSSNNTNQVVGFYDDGSAATPTNKSHVLKDVVCTNVGGVVRHDDDPDWTEAEVVAGALDFCALVNVSVTGYNQYGIYGGWRYFVIDNYTARNCTNAGRLAARCYNPRFLFAREWNVSNANANVNVGIRIIGSDSVTTEFAKWLSFSDCNIWNVQYVFQNEAEALVGLSKWQDQWFFNCQGAPISSGGTGYAFGGDYSRVSVRACMTRSGTFSLLAPNANNDHYEDMYFECNTSTATVTGGNTVGLSCDSADIDVVFQSNYFYVSGSGTSSFCANSITGVAVSTLATSNYNVLLNNGANPFNWFWGWTGGGVALGSWDDTGKDVNSSETSGSTHALTSLGTAGGGTGAAIDIDFHLSGTGGPADDAGTAVFGADIDCDGEVRVATHDAGAHDLSATDPPTQPDIGAEGDEPPTWRNTGFNNLGLNLPVI
jgi:hypothetical protein